MIIVNIVVVVVVVVVIVVVVEFQLNYKDTITECSMCILPVTVTNELNFKKVCSEMGMEPWTFSLSE